ncbi:hypothetical protein D3C85_1861090 [compost metagenome]
MKVQPKGKTPPAPERTVSGAGSKVGATDAQLDKLRAEAERTGNYTKLMEYKKKQREKSRA